MRNGIKILLFALISSSLLIAGCSGKPRLRKGAYFGSLISNGTPDINDLGRHKRSENIFEKNGIVYTCKGGFIDVGHLREAADRTAYIATLTNKKLLEGQTSFSFKVIEPAKYIVDVNYPLNWHDLPEQEKEQIASQISIAFGQYVAHNMTIWHEIITWFGFASTAIFSEQVSAFSWEDPYSDLLGTYLAAKALTEPDYEKAMDRLIIEEFKALDIQPPEVAKQAIRKISGQWYAGGYYFFVDMKKRNFDVGIDDGQVTPWLVPDMCPDAEPKLYPVPKSDIISCCGIDFKLKIKPVEFQKYAIYKIIYPETKGKYIVPAEHFPLIIEHIQKQAIEEYGPQVIEPNL